MRQMFTQKGLVEFLIKHPHRKAVGMTSRWIYKLDLNSLLVYRSGAAEIEEYPTMEESRYGILYHVHYVLLDDENQPRPISVFEG